jgi:hypothetical protein
MTTAQQSVWLAVLGACAGPAGIWQAKRYYTIKQLECTVLHCTAHIQVVQLVQPEGGVKESRALSGDGAGAGAVLLPLVVPEAAVCRERRIR